MRTGFTRKFTNDKKQTAKQKKERQQAIWERLHGSDETLKIINSK